jgi:GT2 family glycosyltransferase
VKASLIVSVYKNTADLKVILDALVYQTEKNFEIIISEDGNSDGMRDFIENYKSPFKILHLTQADEGWRKNQALNNAIRSASSPYLIFIDGDCVLHHRFIENHLRFASSRSILAGKRIKLGTDFSKKLRTGSLPEFEKSFLPNTFALFKDGVKFFEEGIYVNPDSPLGALAGKRTMKMLKGCNFSCYKEAIEDINGFDEDYQKPAIGEDIDLTWRFKGLGYKIDSVRNFAVQYHLYHKENWTSQEENIAIMEKKQAAQAFRCQNGLKKL